MQKLSKTIAFPIDEITFKVEDLLLTEPLRIANESYSSSKTVFVTVKARGFEGIGEAAPDKEVTDEDSYSVSSFIERAAKELKGKDAVDFKGINRELDEISKRDNTAKAGIDLALYDLTGKILRKYLHSPQ